MTISDKFSRMLSEKSPTFPQLGLVRNKHTEKVQKRQILPNLPSLHRMPMPPDS